MLTDSRARALVVSDVLYPRFANLVGACPDLEHVIVSGADAHGHHRFEDLLGRGARPTPLRRRPRATTWRSGSTPRARPASRRAPCMCMPTCRSPMSSMPRPSLGLNENDVCYSVAKLFFAYGLGNALTFPMSVGATTVLLPDRPTPDVVAALLREHQVTVFYARADLLCRLPGEHGGARAREEVKLRRCVSAGEALPPEVGRRWHERYGVDILDGIGSTEMLHIFLSNRPDDVKYGTSGQPLPGYDLKIVDDEGVRGSARRDRRVAGARTDQRDDVLEQPGAVARDLPRRMDAHRRQISRRRGRLLRLLRPARRHAEGLGPLCLAVRGRGRAAVARRRARMRGGGLAR